MVPAAVFHGIIVASHSCTLDSVRCEWGSNCYIFWHLQKCNHRVYASCKIRTMNGLRRNDV